MKISIDITGKQLADLKELAKGAKTTIGMTAAGIVGLYLEGKLVDKPVGKDIKALDCSTETAKKYPFSDLGDRCRVLRKERGLSQLDIVRHFDFSLSHYQKIERGVLDPRFTTLKKLAKAYGTISSHLMKGL